jgi:hypothetical protein
MARLTGRHSSINKRLLIVMRARVFLPADLKRTRRTYMSTILAFSCCYTARYEPRRAYAKANHFFTVA